MKKLYLEQNYVFHNTKKSKDEMAKRTHKKNKKNVSKSSFIRRITCINAPEYFSLIENTKETQLFFSNIFDNINKREFYINLKPVTKLTIETV